MLVTLGLIESNQLTSCTLELSVVLYHQPFVHVGMTVWLDKGNIALLSTATSIAMVGLA